MPPRRSNRVWLGAAILVVTLAKAVVVVVGPPPTVWEDGEIAASLVTTGAFVFQQHGDVSHSFQFPVYPSLVAGLYRIVGVRPTFVPLLNILLSALTAWILVDLFGRLFDRFDFRASIAARRDLIVGLSVAAFLAHPLISYYAMRNVHPFTADALMLYLSLWMLVRYFDNGERRRDLSLFAVAAGVAILDRPVLGVTLLVLLLVTLQRSGMRVALVRTALAAAGAFLVGLPWLVHNYRTDHIVAYTSTATEQVWKGALPGSEGSNWINTNQAYDERLTPDERARLDRMTIREQNQFFVSKYREILRTQPLEVARLFAVKLKNFFWFRSLIGSTYSPAIRRLVPIYQAAYAAVLVLALGAIVLVPPARRWVWSLIVGLSVMQAAVYVETRHRLIVEPLLIFLALCVLAALWAARQDAVLRVSVRK